MLTSSNGHLYNQPTYDRQTAGLWRLHEDRPNDVLETVPICCRRQSEVHVWESNDAISQMCSASTQAD